MDQPCLIPGFSPNLTHSEDLCEHLLLNPEHDRVYRTKFRAFLKKPDLRPMAQDKTFLTAGELTSDGL